MKALEVGHRFVDLDGNPYQLWEPGEELVILRTEFHVTRGNRFSNAVDGVFVHTVVTPSTIQEEIL